MAPKSDLLQGTLDLLILRTLSGDPMHVALGPSRSVPGDPARTGLDCLGGGLSRLSLAVNGTSLPSS